MNDQQKQEAVSALDRLEAAANSGQGFYFSANEAGALFGYIAETDALLLETEAMYKKLVAKIAQVSNITNR